MQIFRIAKLKIVATPDADNSASQGSFRIVSQYRRCRSIDLKIQQRFPPATAAQQNQHRKHCEKP